jgi:hypothetical protein
VHENELVLLMTASAALLIAKTFGGMSTDEGCEHNFRQTLAKLIEELHNAHFGVMARACESWRATKVVAAEESLHKWLHRARAR